MINICGLTVTSHKICHQTLYFAKDNNQSLNFAVFVTD